MKLGPRIDKGPIFEAQFDSDCDRCGGEICEGDKIRYIDGEVACPDCVEEVG